MVEAPISIDVVNKMSSYLDASVKKRHIREELWTEHDIFYTKIYATRMID